MTVQATCRLHCPRLRCLHPAGESRLIFLGLPRNLWVRNDDGVKTEPPLRLDGGGAHQPPFGCVYSFDSGVDASLDI